MLFRARFLGLLEEQLAAVQALRQENSLLAYYWSLSLQQPSL